jgi:hypothetical protein
MTLEISIALLVKAFRGKGGVFKYESTWAEAHPPHGSRVARMMSGVSKAKGGDVRGELVFSVRAAAGWFCEKSGCIGKVEDVKPVFFNFLILKTDFNWQPS